MGARAPHFVEVRPNPQVPADVGQKRRRGEAESFGTEFPGRFRPEIRKEPVTIEISIWLEVKKVKSKL
jgi:hypothetical protein